MGSNPHLTLQADAQTNRIWRYLYPAVLIWYIYIASRYRYSQNWAQPRWR